uniref:Uncharacterized protein n=1 Tax=Arundo donax TaxID=35708 RepID=A0A0A8ZXB1_ARUDO
MKKLIAHDGIDNIYYTAHIIIANHRPIPISFSISIVLPASSW